MVGLYEIEGGIWLLWRLILLGWYWWILADKELIHIEDVPI
jgi:hypothetical protein